jgi:fumarate reductase subunit C
MKPAGTHTPYHPRWYRRRVSTYWWLQKASHLKFILRELSSLAVAYFVALVLLHLGGLTRGPEAYAEFQNFLRRPFLIALNTLALFFVIFHTITWLNLAPRAMVLRLGGKRIPDTLIAASNYIAWFALSAVVAWVVLGG